MKPARRFNQAIALLFISFSSLASAQPADQKLIYTSDRGVEFEVTADGISSIRAGGRELAHGGWSFFDAAYWFSNAAPQPPKTPQKRFEKLNDRHARVIHTADDLLCTYDYLFAGEDLTISARVENRNPDSAIEVS